MFLNAGTFGNIPFLAGKKTQDTYPALLHIIIQFCSRFDLPFLRFFGRF